MGGSWLTSACSPARNTKGDPNHASGWLLLVVLLPFLGILFYMVSRPLDSRGSTDDRGRVTRTQNERSLLGC
jgi:hypothetical protein